MAGRWSLEVGVGVGDMAVGATAGITVVEVSMEAEASVAVMAADTGVAGMAGIGKPRTF